MSVESKVSVQPVTIIQYTDTPLYEPMPPSYLPDGREILINTLRTSRPTYSPTDSIFEDRDRNEAYAQTESLRREAKHRADQDAQVIALQEVLHRQEIATPIVKTDVPPKAAPPEPQTPRVQEPVSFFSLDKSEKRMLHHFLKIYNLHIAENLGGSPLESLLQIKSMVKDEEFHGIIPPENRVRTALGIKEHDDLDCALQNKIGSIMNSYPAVMASYNGLDRWRNEYFTQKFETQPDGDRSSRVTMLASAALLFQKNNKDPQLTKIWADFVSDPRTTGLNLALIYLTSQGLDMKSMAYVLHLPVEQIRDSITNQMPTLLQDSPDPTLEKIRAFGRSLFIKTA